MQNHQAGKKANGLYRGRTGQGKTLRTQTLIKSLASASQTDDDDRWYEGMKEVKRERNLQNLAGNMNVLRESGLRFTLANEGLSVLFREKGKPKVDFFPSTGKWRVANVTKTFHGSAVAFLEWYAKQT